MLYYHITCEYCVLVKLHKTTIGSLQRQYRYTNNRRKTLVSIKQLFSTNQKNYQILVNIL